ncbi:exonuclease subunit SbcC [Almyronema epifaneia]|uniref:Nuclease SbcCD subunit C n=1 Tax=Almyronema epifaneia S1 TaxID=2991925 RepID=A0ABW6IFM0_9CYAN
MIPRQITLRNFLSYQQATLDFRGLHVACICGPNGAGKSSLLEAIAWVVWGQSRAATEDDVIHLGEAEAKVDFVFDHHAHTYRVIRARRRGQSSSLEFQVKTQNGFRPLTQRGMRATQQLIQQHLKLDYETFVNSAYLRQGRADEFMLKRPSERKQILADLLKLGQYDQLAEQAKEKARDIKAQVNLLETSLAALNQQLQARGGVAQAYQDLKAQLAKRQRQQQQWQQQLDAYLDQQQQRQRWQQQQQLYQQQQASLQQACQRLAPDLESLQTQQQQLKLVVEQAAAIAAGCQQLAQLQQQDGEYNRQFQLYQQAQAQLSQIQQPYQAALAQAETQLQQAELSLSNLNQQLQETQQSLAKAAEIEAALIRLHQAQAQLSQFDQAQLKVMPLLQQRQVLQAQIAQTQAQLMARLEALKNTEQQLQQQQSQQPQLQQAVMDVACAVEYLERRRNYQEQVREKGLERRSFMERLQANQRTYEIQLAQLEQKLQLLSAPEAVCPVCDRPLDPKHWQHVVKNQRQQHQETQHEIWVIREQLATSEKEIQILRREYREIEAELATYGPILERRGQLQVQLSSSTDAQTRLDQLQQERSQLEHCLQEKHFASDLHEELALIDAQLVELDYDDCDHALARSQVERLRWAEIKHTELQQARRREAQLLSQQPELAAQVAACQQQLAALSQAPERQQIQQLEQQLATSGYSFEQHQSLRTDLQQAQIWQLRQQELTQAQQQLPQVGQRLTQLTQLQRDRQQELSAIAEQLNNLEHQLQQRPDPQPDIAALEQQLQTEQAERDQKLAYLGRLQQQLDQFDQLQQQHDHQQQALDQAKRQARIYTELTYAFGRNGIQALMIENLLPQLEAETNQILGRLSANQLHVQFLTQRAGRSRNKLIDTLDILIADARGTRPYETYSGGEAFRVNFAIRLAIARLLAQRSGTALQMLIVDEGFGTQDQEGCERLITAINAIAADFACILTVTHMPHFREAFQARIDVLKTPTGSQIQLSV